MSSWPRVDRLCLRSPAPYSALSIVLVYVRQRRDWLRDKVRGERERARAEKNQRPRRMRNRSAGATRQIFRGKAKPC